MKNNWLYSDFESVVITLEECKSTTKNNGTCANTTEIVKFMDENLFYFINQNTFVAPKIYSKNSSLDL